MKMNRRENKLCVGKTLVAGIAAAWLGLAVLAQGQAAGKTETVTGALIVKAQPSAPKVPLFFTADVVNTVVVSRHSIAQSVVLKLHKLQGEDAVMSVKLSRKLDDMKVTGTGLKEWALREQGGDTYLDISAKDSKAKSLVVTLAGQQKWKVGSAKIMTLAPAAQTGAAGFDERILVSWQAGMHLRVTQAEGLVNMKLTRDSARKLGFISQGRSALTLHPYASDAGMAGVDLRNLSLTAVVAADGNSAELRLQGRLHVRELSDKKFVILTGKAGLLEFPQIAGVGMNVDNTSKGTQFSVVCQKIGVFAVDMRFVVSMAKRVNGWKTLAFSVPNGAVVPLTLKGIKENVQYHSEHRFMLSYMAGDWLGVLPATGRCLVQWKNKRGSGDGELFYTSKGLTTTAVGAGLVLSTSTVEFKVLQGKMAKVVFDLGGDGDVISVWGSHIASWKVKQVDGKNVLECLLNSARSDVGSIRIASQHPIGKFPATVTPLKLTPQRAMRHSGFIKISNKGAVRIEASKVEGMMQLAPNQFPGGKVVKGRQAFVYRYPSADRSIEISATQIVSEVELSQILVYELGSTDRIIHADLELDIREAGLREWSFKSPEDYAVAQVESAQMAD